jgi:hypothetical protein
MKELFPFIEYIIKGPDQKGHVKSMNIIREYAMNGNYDIILHMEDDWHFVQKRNFITEALEIFDADENIKQVLFNLNYYEVEPFKKRIDGGIPKHTRTNLPFVVHEHYPKCTLEYQAFINRNHGKSTCAYWPHYSLRPSLLKVDALRNVGEYPQTTHFEMAYANEYTVLGYKSAFFDTFSCIHIGKKTWEKDVKNSYQLNDVPQFVPGEVSTGAVLLCDGTIRHDRWKELKVIFNKSFAMYHQKEIIKVEKLNTWQCELFVDNDFNYARPVLNPIATTLEILRDNKNENLFILRYDMDFVKDFDKNVKNLIESLSGIAYDIVLLDDSSELIRLNLTELSLEREGGILVSAAGCKKIIERLSDLGVTSEEYMNGVVEDLVIYQSGTKLYEEYNTFCNMEYDVNEIEGFTFYSQLDSFCEDVGNYGEMSIDELKELCIKHDYAGFNTYGWVKHTINPINDFIFLPGSTKTTDGLYVMK